MCTTNNITYNLWENQDVAISFFMLLLKFNIVEHRRDVNAMTITHMARIYGINK